MNLLLRITLLPPRNKWCESGVRRGGGRRRCYPHFESKSKSPKTGESAFGSVGVMPGQMQAGRHDRPLLVLKSRVVMTSPVLLL
jgi:hypothetical protein